MKFLKLIIIIVAIITQSCVQETHTKTITFKADMNIVENPKNVGVRGSFTSNPWNETAPLTDEDDDGIYEGTFSQKTAINQIEFKFVNNNSDYELADLKNRVIEFEYKPEIITYKAVFNDPNSIKTITD
ncbi:hypothetical protein [Winogradskyella luteola]|uniref:Uncharacterized protein n=1 Tax=Winogradskyella luteola TaxID=2828330 RepID=A0A9X1JP76_9FLAO|nr:hypothetical protein [Winogradskyella luteola]MBV7267593.1 hypothetical protein [Winogradskyella luteola]